jgi:tetratricopeptide (TPR) repeat protein
MRARNLLLLYAAGEHYQQQGFGNREAIAKALVTLETTTQGRLLPGLQSRAAVLDQAAVALVWTEENRIASYRQQPPPLAQFRPAYCQALYPTAKALFQENQHRQALAIYQEMHRLQCRQPMAYFLDAAECFLALQQPEDARRMANYLLTEYATALGSGEAERAGDVLFKAGDEENARKAYELALSKLREDH